MNEDDIDDLKQFITATVTQQIVGLRQDFNRLESKVDALEFKVDVIDQKVDNLSVAVADALDTSNETAEERFNAVSLAWNTKQPYKTKNTSE